MPHWICRPIVEEGKSSVLYGIELFSFLQLAAVVSDRDGAHIDFVVGFGPLHVKLGLSLYER